MTTVRIPTPLRPYAEGQSEVSVQGNRVDEALHSLAIQFPAL